MEIFFDERHIINFCGIANNLIQPKEKKFFIHQVALKGKSGNLKIHDNNWVLLLFIY
jgi:hypothetical protein